MSLSGYESRNLAFLNHTVHKLKNIVESDGLGS